MKPDRINFQAYKYAESTLPQFNEICSPLFESGIKVFAYFRFFNNGRYLYLCNNLPWVQYCLENVHNNEGTSLGEEIGYVPEHNYYCFLWPTVKTDYLMTALYDFDIWNGLSIFKHHEDSIELWGFAADRSAENMQSFYLENIEIFKDFTSAFNIQASGLILPTHKNLAIYRDFKPVKPMDEYDNIKIAEFIKATPIKKCPLITPVGEVFLTTKELECLNSLACGKNTKQIAQQVNVSNRTIEKHLENIKQKSGNKNKMEIIKYYKDSLIHWL